MNTRTLMGALPGLCAAALFGVGCGELAGPAAPDFWNHPPPPQLHLVLTVSSGAALDAPGCALVSGVNTFVVTVTVQDAANNTVTDLDGTSAMLTIEHDANPLAPAVAATLCGATSGVIAGGVAQFTLGIDLPSTFPPLMPPELYTLRGHATGATDGISTGICIGPCFE